jgi:hypothetical protein
MTDLEEVPAYSIVKEVAGKGEEMLDHCKVWSIEEMERFTLHGHFEDAWCDTWMVRFSEARAVAEKVANRSFHPIEALSPLEVEQWRQEMKGEFSKALNAWASDAAHWMPLHAFLFPLASSSFRAFNRIWICKQLIVPGRFAIIDGDLDSGKTDNAILLTEVIGRAWEEYERARAEKLEKTSDLYAVMKEHEGEPKEESLNLRQNGLIQSEGPRFISNIEVQIGHPLSKYYQFATRLTDMIILMAKNAKAGYFSVLILDEMGMTYNRKRVTSRQNFSLEGIFRLVRKFNASVIVITQNKELDLPDHLRRPDKGAKTIIEKIRKDTAIYTVYGVAQLYHQKVYGIPPTSLPFETHAVASLAIDIDPRALVEEVELLKSQSRDGHGKSTWDMDDTYKAIIAACEARQMGKELSKVKREQVLSMLQSLDPMTGSLYSPEDIMEELGVSEAFVAECQQTIHAVQASPEPDAGVLEERVLALSKLKLPLPEVARLAGTTEDIVKAVLAKHPPTQKVKKPPAPPPAGLSPKVVEVA